MLIPGRRTTRLLAACLLGMLLIGCTSVKPLPGSRDDGRIDIAFLQMNDVYEIDGLEGGKIGGLARVAHLYQEVQRKHPQAMLVLAGDFLNPSLIGTMRVHGERVRGRQMVEVLNAIGLDLAAFGNHEFDISEGDLQKRINESEFDWIATNIQQVCGDRLYPFYKETDGRKHFIPEHRIYEFTDSDGTTARVGIVSATLDSNPRDYVTYFNWDSCAALEIARMKPQSDILVGLTHLEIEQDMQFVEMNPGLALVMGGHEHHNMHHMVDGTPIAKADANAKTVYLHVISLDKKRGTIDVSSELMAVDQTVRKDPAIDQLVQRWKDVRDSFITEVVADPYEVVYIAATPLDGRESTLRHRPSNMGKLFCEAMLANSRQNATAAIMNSGSIRIDDQMEGEIVAIDIFRALPFGGGIVEITVGGNLLFGILRFGEESQGNGAYLQYSGIEGKGEEWFINGQPLDRNAEYTIAINDFLLTGLDIPFLTEENTGIMNVYKPDRGDSSDLRNDIRRVIIDYLKSR